MVGVLRRTLKCLSAFEAMNINPDPTSSRADERQAHQTVVFHLFNNLEHGIDVFGISFKRPLIWQFPTVTFGGKHHHLASNHRGHPRITHRTCEFLDNLPSL